MSIYNVSGDTINSAYCLSDSLQYAYNINGSEVFETNPTINYEDYTVTTLFNYPEGGMQAFAVYDGKIAQVRETSALHIIDIATGTNIRNVSMNTGHGNSCQFSDEFYDDSDEFPLFYVRNAGVYVYRITGETSTLIRKYSFSTDIIGTYVAGFCFNPASNRFYTASYTEGDYTTKTGLLRICKWNMRNATNNGDGTYSMDLLASNDLTWFDNYQAVQGCCYHDGYFFIACGYTSGAQYIVMVDTSTLTISHSLRVSPDRELEGCAWVDNGGYLLIGQKTNTYDYKKMEFETTIMEESHE